MQGDSPSARRRGRRFVLVLVAGHVATAFVVVAMLQLIGTLTFAHLPYAVRLWAVGVAAVAGVGIDIRAFIRKQFSLCVARQTPKAMANEKSPRWWLTPLFWGMDTGTLMTTYRVSFASWVVLFAALLLVAPPYAGLVFGAAFGIPLVVAMFVGDPDQFGRSGSRARVWRPRIAQLVAGITLLVLPWWLLTGQIL